MPANLLTYVVTGSEDGVVGVATSAQRAAEMAVGYVWNAREFGPLDDRDAKVKRVASELRRQEWVTVNSASLKGLAAMSGSVEATVQTFEANYAPWA